MLTQTASRERRSYVLEAFFFVLPAFLAVTYWIVTFA